MQIPARKRETRVLLFSAFTVGVCGLSYELLIGSLLTSLEGNPILQYSLTIGFFMSALGLGSYLSRLFTTDLLKHFIAIEIALGLVGGLSIAALNFVYITAYSVFMPAVILALVLVGVLVGLEIPILMRVLESNDSLKKTISDVLTMDYVGGLVASLVFPLVLYPNVGLMKTSFIIGFVNVLVGVLNLVLFARALRPRPRLRMAFACFFGLVFLGGGFGFSSVLTGYYSRAIYGAVLFQEQSRYQKIVLTREHGEMDLYLDGHLQFAGAHEYRYHEALVFPPFYVMPRIPRVLVMGAGDGLAVRQLLKFPTVERITLVDLDPAMTRLASRFRPLRLVNNNALNSPRVRVINDDAYGFLKHGGKQYDVIYADFPDPHDAVIAKLYSEEFNHFVKRNLAPGGIFITQAGSPLHTRMAFWCIGKTLGTVFKTVIPYRMYGPRLKDRGFFLATDRSIALEKLLESGGATGPRKALRFRFFSRDVFRAALVFPADSTLRAGEVVQVNRLLEPVLYKYYLNGWKHL